MKIRAAGFNPFRVDACLWMRSQGSPKRATLGWMIQSLWDWMARSCRASDGAIPLRLESHGLSESQRDSILQPRVARHELPWGTNRHRASTLQGLNRTGKHAVNTPRLKNFPQLRLLEVIRKKQLLLLRNRLFGDGRKLRRIRGEGGGGDEAGEGEEAGVQGGVGSGVILENCFTYIIASAGTRDLRGITSPLCIRVLRSWDKGQSFHFRKEHGELARLVICAAAQEFLFLSRQFYSTGRRELIPNHLKSTQRVRYYCVVGIEDVKKRSL